MATSLGRVGVLDEGECVRVKLESLWARRQVELRRKVRQVRAGPSPINGRRRKLEQLKLAVTTED